MNLQGFYTAKGLVLAAKVSAGTKLTVTKVTAGGGTTAANALALAEEKQTLTVGTAEISGQTATLPVTLAEAKAGASYTLTELGVYARDPDAGEILYQVFRLDTSRGITAGGENAYRFYLKVIVGKDGVAVATSPAGLLIDEDLESIRGRVMAMSAPARTVSLEASELQSYLNALPRMLTEQLTISVHGTLTAGLALDGFYGPGSLLITGANTTFTISGEMTASRRYGILVRNCAVPVRFQMVNIQTTPSGSTEDICVTSCCSYVEWDQCTFTNNGSDFAIRARRTAVMQAKDCTFSGYYLAVNAEEGTIAAIKNCSGTGNTVGIRVIDGSAALLAGTTPELLGGTVNSHSGGIIAKSDGTLI